MQYAEPWLAESFSWPAFFAVTRKGSIDANRTCRRVIASRQWPPEAIKTPEARQLCPVWRSRGGRRKSLRCGGNGGEVATKLGRELSLHLGCYCGVPVVFI